MKRSVTSCLVIACICAGCSSKEEAGPGGVQINVPGVNIKVDEKGGASVQVPGVDIKAGETGASVKAPGVDIKADGSGASVKAPGVDLNAKPN